MIEKNLLGKFIKVKREEAGLSQKMFAEQLFVTESAVSKWERGVNYPDITMISDICRVLNISEKELITASEDTSYRKMKKQSAKYEKIKFLTFWLPTSAYLLTIFICLICTLSGAMQFSTLLIVFASLLCAFLFFPSATGFFGNHKLSAYLVSSLIGVAILMIVCGAVTKNLSWVPTAVSGTLLGYSAIFLPIILKKYAISGFVSGHKTLISFIFDFILTAATVASVKLLAPIDISKAELLVLYCFTPFLITGLIVSLRINGLIKGGICTAIFGLFTFSVNYVVNYAFNTPTNMEINLYDWSACTNGNVLLTILLVCILIGIILTGFGIKQKKK